RDEDGESKSEDSDIINIKDVSQTMPTPSTGPALEPYYSHNQVKNQARQMDHFMRSPASNNQERDGSESPPQQQPSPQGIEGKKIMSMSCAWAQRADVILPLSTGYLIQVPIQSNSVMREKHCLEALGIEVHLMHLQRAGVVAGSQPQSGAGP